MGLKIDLTDPSCEANDLGLLDSAARRIESLSGQQHRLLQAADAQPTIQVENPIAPTRIGRTFTNPLQARCARHIAKRRYDRRSEFSEDDFVVPIASVAANAKCG